MLMFYQDPEKYIPACYTKVGYFKDGSDLKWELQDVCVILSRIAPPFQTMNPISFFSSSLISSMNLAGLALRL